MIRSVSEGIWRGPRLLPKEYDELLGRCIKVVVNLESNEEAFLDDQRECNKYGISCIHYPMSELWPINTKHLEHIADEVWNLKYYNVYIH